MLGVGLLTVLGPLRNDPGCLNCNFWQASQQQHLQRTDALHSTLDGFLGMPWECSGESSYCHEPVANGLDLCDGQTLTDGIKATEYLCQEVYNLQWREDGQMAMEELGSRQLQWQKGGGTAKEGTKEGKGCE